jgi:hypothetical protein
LDLRGHLLTEFGGLEGNAPCRSPRLPSPPPAARCASGTLTAISGGVSANITLLGQYVTGNFHIQSDGAGGTLVTDPPVSAPTDQNPIALLHAQH